MTQMVNPTSVMQVHQACVMEMKPAAMNFGCLPCVCACSTMPSIWMMVGSIHFLHHVEVVQVKLVVQVGGVQVK